MKINVIINVLIMFHTFTPRMTFFPFPHADGEVRIEYKETKLSSSGEPPIGIILTGQVDAVRVQLILEDRALIPGFVNGSPMQVAEDDAVVRVGKLTGVKMMPSGKAALRGNEAQENAVEPRQVPRPSRKTLHIVPAKAVVGRLGVEHQQLHELLVAIVILVRERLPAAIGVVQVLTHVLVHRRISFVLLSPSPSWSAQQRQEVAQLVLRTVKPVTLEIVIVTVYPARMYTPMIALEEVGHIHIHVLIPADLVSDLNEFNVRNDFVATGTTGTIATVGV